VIRDLVIVSHDGLLGRVLDVVVGDCILGAVGCYFVEVAAFAVEDAVEDAAFVAEAVDTAFAVVAVEDAAGADDTASVVEDAAYHEETDAAAEAVAIAAATWLVEECYTDSIQMEEWGDSSVVVAVLGQTAPDSLLPLHADAAAEVVAAIAAALVDYTHRRNCIQEK